MKSYRKTLIIHFPSRKGLEDITDQIQEVINESGIKEGIILVNALHPTASVFIHEDEASLQKEYEKWIETKNIIGREVVCAITDGRLDIGTWELIFYFEFDGNRDEKVLIKILGE